MKPIIAIFSVFFVLMFYTGYKRGDSFVNDPNFLENFAFSNIGIQKIEEDYQFTYSSKGQLLYWFDVDENKLHRASIETLEIENSNRLELPASFILNDPSIPAAIGGVTFGFSAKDILQDPKKVANALKNKKSAKMKRFIAGTFGMVSGYSAGYWLATRGKLPSLDDTRLLAIVKTEKQWVKWEIDVLVNIYSKLKRITHAIENSEEKKQYEYLLDRTAALAVKRSEEGDLLSKDLNALAMLDNIIREKYEENLEKQGLMDKILFYYIPWGLFSLFVGALLFIGVSSFIESRKRA